ncbi:signal transduction histidine kinase [Micromonospora sp. Llam0]|uniref:sensor histidine kinase n=1 Tax=Micromonospora sp. Llam0 TaxID=2485143 RepID=UPI000F9175F8|nr:ATP-binding protein [Micromonospora sp. Llam0]ROO51992.1 signal transduction histidine kinase [Micromonospora sp. Llam0]
MSTLLARPMRPAADVTASIDAMPRIFRLVMLIVGVHRAISLATVLAEGSARPGTSMSIAVALTTAWGCILLWDAWRHAAFRQPLAVLDVGLAAGIGLLALAGGWEDLAFSYGSLHCAAIVAGWALSTRAVMVALASLVTIPLLLALHPADAVDITVPQVAAHTATLVVIALVAGATRRTLLATDDTIGRCEDAGETQWDAPESRRVVHDTALATLTAIASGRLDANSDQVRALAARDATYLRTIMQGGTVASDSLPAALASVAADATGIGLRLHPLLAPLSSSIDRRAVTAIAMACREALNNTHRHARTGEAWLTAGMEDGAVVVRIVDRGVGFEPVDETTPGTGIRTSIIARMREVGGTASVHSVPGDGTCVELKWPQ